MRSGSGLQLIIIIASDLVGEKKKTKTTPDAFIHSDLVILNLVLIHLMLSKSKEKLPPNDSILKYQN